MIITPTDLEVYQHCPARWKLRDQFPLDEFQHSEIIQALRKTIFSMYAWQMSTGRRMRMKSVKERWDQNWWLTGMKDKTKDKQKVFDTAADGWLKLQRYWVDVYKEHTGIPVGVNFPYSYHSQGIDFQVEYDLILAEEDGSISFIEFGGPRNEWQIFTSLATKTEVCCLTEAIGKIPFQKRYMDLGVRRRTYVEKQLSITEAFVEDAQQVITAVAGHITNDTIYCAPSDSCTTCPAKGKCWF